MWLAASSWSVSCGFQVDQAKKQRKSVSLSNNAASFRDKDAEQVWKFACVFTWALPAAEANMSAEEVKEVKSAFYRGALDDSLRDVVTLMSPTLKPTDLRFTKTAAQLEQDQAAAAKFSSESGSQVRWRFLGRVR